MDARTPPVVAPISIGFRKPTTAAIGGPITFAYHDRMNATDKKSPLVVCGGCRCWCDDIQQTTSGWLHACPKGELWLNRPASQPPPGAEPNLSKLAQLLTQAKQPALMGLVDLDIDAQRWAVAVADFNRAFIDPCLSNDARAKMLSLQQVGQVSATWGELRQRADVVVYWNCRPADAPRFRQRYGDRSEIGPTSRQVFAICSDETAGDWDESVNVVQCDSQQLLQRLESQDTEESDPLRRALHDSRYAVWVMGSGPAGSLVQQQSFYQRLTRWIAAHNDGQRMVMVPWADGQGNATGILSVMTWRTGYPMAVDFSTGCPRYRIPENFWEQVLQSGAADLVLWLGSASDESRLAIESFRQAHPSAQVVQISRESQWPGTQHFPVANHVSTLGSRCFVQRPDSVMLPASHFDAGYATLLQALYQLQVATA